MKIRLALCALTIGVMSSCANPVSMLNRKSVSSSDDSPIVSRSVDVKNFSEIMVTEGMTVIFTQGKEYNVKVDAPEDIIDYIVVESDGENLMVHRKENVDIRKGQHRVKIYVTAPEVRELNATTAARIECDTLRVKELEIDATTSATVYVAYLESEDVDISATTASTVKVGGICKDVDFTATTAATINCSELKAVKGDATASTAASISCNVEKLDRSESTAGSVRNNE